MAQATLSETTVSLNVQSDAPVGPVLQMVDGRPVVSSVKIAEHFKKPHNRVLAVIRSTMKSLPDDFRLSNFRQTMTRRPMPKGNGYRDDPSFDIARDGFTLIVMSFTGKEAMAWKLRYIEAFNAMEAELAGQRQQPAFPAPSTVEDRRPLADICNLLVELKFKPAPVKKDYAKVRSDVSKYMGVEKWEDIAAENIGKAVAFVQKQIDALALPEAPAAETPALPPGRTRNTLGEYEALFKGLPESPQYWMDLLSRYSLAHEVLGNELEAVKAEATKPFRVGRKSMVQTYFDASMSPMYSLFETAEKSLHLAYCQIFDAMEGCRNIWMLLKKG